MFAGAAMFASFGAFYFYFPAIFGVKFSRLWGYLHITYFLLGQLMTVAPMFWLGYSGMPRRILDYPAALGGWHAIVSAGHLLSVAGIMAFFIMIFDSLRQGRAATRNSFGVSRFNTRLNFYLYEVARTRHVQRRGWYTSRYSRRYSLQLNEDNYENYALTELTLSSYNFVLVKPKAKKSFPEIGIHN
jgi:heme/copper-type cytochrome/quinol oxidase subunit 1